MISPAAALCVRLRNIIRGWERAEGILILQAWVSSDTGAWRVEWTEKGRRGQEQYRAGEDHQKVSRLILDMQQAARDYGIAIRHLIPWGNGGIQIWYIDDSGRRRTHIYDPAGDRRIAMARETLIEGGKK